MYCLLFCHVNFTAYFFVNCIYTSKIHEIIIIPFINKVSLITITWWSTHYTSIIYFHRNQILFHFVRASWPNKHQAKSSSYHFLVLFLNNLLQFILVDPLKDSAKLLNSFKKHHLLFQWKVHSLL